MANSTVDQRQWKMAYDGLIGAVTSLEFPEELGNEIAKNLGSPKAMRRMTSYLCQVKPKKAEIVVDEMLAIREEIAAWREKKDAEEAHARYNEMRRNGRLEP